MKKAIILSNLGTPEAPTTLAVTSYLKEFLSDPDVIPLPSFLRIPLVNFLIVPKRAPQSAEKYHKIWTKQGSPLLVNSLDLQESVQNELEIPVYLGMRYGNPSLESALEKAMIAGVEEIYLFPLYPQFAAATTGSTEKKFREVCATRGYQGNIHVNQSFPTADFFIEAQAALVAEQRKNSEFLVFTFHGLPQSEVKKIDSSCLRESSCCESITEKNKNCYRAQCFATAQKLAEKLQLTKSQWTISFQSRLGPAKWIGPYTENILKDLPAAGTKSVLLVAPSFVADCLETLEELRIQGREIFQQAGGETFSVVDCVNSSPVFTKALARELRQISSGSV